MGRGVAYIEDEVHSEQVGPSEDFADALAALRRRAAVPWDTAPNKAPCSSLEDVRRQYHVLEYAADQELWTLLRKSMPSTSPQKGPPGLKGLTNTEAFGSTCRTFLSAPSTSRPRPLAAVIRVIDCRKRRRRGRRSAYERIAPGGLMGAALHRYQR
jgi:hypothetical protein